MGICNRQSAPHNKKNAYIHISRIDFEHLSHLSLFEGIRLCELRSAIEKLPSDKLLRSAKSAMQIVERLDNSSNIFILFIINSHFDLFLSPRRIASPFNKRKAKELPTDAQQSTMLQPPPSPPPPPPPSSSAAQQYLSNIPTVKRVMMSKPTVASNLPVYYQSSAIVYCNGSKPQRQPSAIKPSDQQTVETNKSHLATHSGTNPTVHPHSD